ncbi:MAG: dihydroneopterin aldolase [Firmicutes bacterium]|nr:dihydroneopterin aldolase [Bacillota bacterium]
MDSIVLKDLHFWGRHGANPGEKEQPQEFVVECEMFFSFEEASRSDDLRFTVDYGRVFADLKRIVEEESFNLLETLAQRLADAALQYPRVRQVRLEVEKCAAKAGQACFRSAVRLERGN